jgi:hypothetical protein
MPLAPSVVTQGSATAAAHLLDRGRAGSQFGTGTNFDFVSPLLGFAWVPDGRQLFHPADSERIWRSFAPQFD